jgi:glutathione S-transferase
MGLSRALNLATSYAASGLRFAAGMYVGKLGPRPAEPIELYEFEACPFCRRVRETLSALDLQTHIYPCPRGGTRYRPIVAERGGREMFPYMIDPNTGAEMYESADIVAYLWKHYGDGSPPVLSRGPLFVLSSSFASATRPTRGRAARGKSAPKEPLELYSFEASPYCRIAREELSALELPYLLHNVAKNSPSRDAFVERSGKMMVPYLIDPNTGTEMFESADIVEYLRETYG